MFLGIEFIKKYSYPSKHHHMKYEWLNRNLLGNTVPVTINLCLTILIYNRYEYYSNKNSICSVICLLILYPIKQHQTAKSFINISLFFLALTLVHLLLLVISFCFIYHTNVCVRFHLVKMKRSYTHIALFICTDGMYKIRRRANR